MWTAEQAHQRVNEFATLDADWDSYGAQTITATAIAKAHELIALRPDGIMFAAPMGDGGVQIEWSGVNGREAEIEIDPDGTLRAFLVIKTYHEESITTHEDALRLIDFTTRGKRVR